MRHAAGWLCWVLVLWSGVAGAAAQSTIPSALQDWQAWVLHGHEQQACALLVTPSGNGDDDRQCVWPAQLALVANKDGAHFRLDVQVGAPSWVALPGSRDAWPQQVQVDAAPAVVLDRDGVPTLRLDTGAHRVQGSLRWNERPARLRLPESIALVDLSVDATAIAQPDRSDGWITLGPGSAQQRTADALHLRVFRRLADGMPPTLTTVVRLQVAGSAREQILGPVLPPGFVATALDGDLPARLDADGRLQVQLRPGNWTLTLAARGTTPLAKIPFTSAPSPWPRQEIWSYADDAALRTTRVGGAPAIDPGQAEVPQAWRGLPAFVMGEGAILDVGQRARGTDANAGDQLRLTRELWLDFDGAGLSANDHLTGTLGSSDRLDVAAPWTLENATLADGAPLLVTRGDAPGTRGVELRTRVLDLHAGLRRPGHAGTQSATGGWLRTLDGVHATLHLPYGYRLLGAPGADHSPDSWIARWNLLDLFVAMLVGLLVWRLSGWRWALVALGFVVLAHGEPGAPLWMPAFAVVLALAARMLRAGRLRGFARGLGIAVLVLAVIATLPFAALQLRDALFPQLEHTGLAWIGPEPDFGSRPARVEFLPPTGRALASASRSAPAQAVMSTPPPPPAPPPPPTPSLSVATSGLQSLVAPDVQADAAQAITTAAYPADTIVQAGRGAPAWSNYGRSYGLGWSGPVTAQQTWRLVILPAWATRVLRVVMLALLIAWLVAIARALGLGARWPARPQHLGTAGAGLLLLLALAPQARAQSLPSPELLSQLQARLLEAPRCAPDCAASPQVEVALQPGSLQATLEVDAATRVAFPLPYMDAPAGTRSVALDGKPATELARRNGRLWIALDRGVHRVTLDFSLPAALASTALHFPLPPPNVRVAAPGWQTGGADGVHLLSDTLTFTRMRTAQAGSGAESTQVFPPYVKLTRSIAIGLDSRVENVVTRVAPAHGGFSVDLPLLAGEHVGTAGLNVTHGRVRVTFGPDQAQARWSSTLDAGSGLKLVAPGLDKRAEEWRIASSPLLHVTTSGVPESPGGDAVRVYRPLPGETLALHIARPVASGGDSLVFDRVALDATRGAHAMASTLTLVVRSTRGGEQTIELPRAAVLQSALRDGEPLDLNVRAGRVALPVQPGTQAFVLGLRESATAGWLTRTPQVALGARAANITTTLNLAPDRWILWTWGPQAGPAVLYWPQLLVLLLAAIALARFAPTPLRWWQWLLLGLGFSTFAWSAFVVVVGWLVVLGLRARGAPTLARLPFNLMQVGVALFTLVALACLVGSVPHGLLAYPDMRIAGASTNIAASSLGWFVDQANGVLPRAGAFTLPLWCYQVVMLIWALWLASALIGWLRWGFRAWMVGGYWKSKPARPDPGVPPAAGA